MNIRRPIKIVVIFLQLLISTNTIAYEKNSALLVDTFIGINQLYFNFEEFSSDNEEIVNETGWLYGYDAGVIANKNRLIGKLLLSHYSGKIDYNGRTQTGTPIRSNTDEKIYSINLSASFNIFQSEEHGYNLRIALEKNKWERDIQAVGSIKGLQETYEWLNLLVGVETVGSVNSIEWQASLSALKTLDPTVEVNFPGAFDTTSLQMSGKLGWRGGVSVRHAFASGYGIGLTGYYEEYKFGKSEARPLTQNKLPAGTLFQPNTKNNNFSVGLQIYKRWE